MELYYERGYKRNIKLGVDGGNWIRTGKFIKIENPFELKEMDDRLDDVEYINHHNFVYKT